MGFVSGLSAAPHRSPSASLSRCLLRCQLSRPVVLRRESQAAREILGWAWHAWQVLFPQGSQPHLCVLWGLKRQPRCTCPTPSVSREVTLHRCGRSHTVIVIRYPGQPGFGASEVAAVWEHVLKSGPLLKEASLPARSNTIITATIFRVKLPN